MDAVLVMHATHPIASRGSYFPQKLIRIFLRLECNASKYTAWVTILTEAYLCILEIGISHVAPTRGLAWGATRSEDQQLPLGCSSCPTQLPLPHQCRGQTCHEPDLPMPTRAAVVWWSQVPPCQQNIPLGRSETATQKYYDSHLFGLVKPFAC